MFEVPPAKRSIKQNLFEFKLPGDPTTYTLPKLQFIKPALVERLDGGKKTDIVRALLDEYLPGKPAVEGQPAIEAVPASAGVKAVRARAEVPAQPAVPSVYDRIEDAEQLVALYEAWAAASGMKLGESSASTGS